MFQQMLNASRAVLLRPSVATFEEFEKDDLGWATIYVVIAAVISAIFAAIGAAVKQETGPGLGGIVIGTPVGVLIGFFIFLGIVFLLGRAFGGTGTFGQLSYDISLFYAPLLALGSLINIIAIGPLAFLTGLIGLVISIYQLYLTYLGIQSGMNLPRDKALYVILIIFLIGLVLVACVAIVLGAFIAAMMNNTTSP
ncbi:MAG TPA: Yip1 family protein [Roseiflexaceae bacterium]|jgi:hypothetical protein|nr:Yip1 family protein [Roseiflexaceae bacterium]